MNIVIVGHIFKISHHGLDNEESTMLSGWHVNSDTRLKNLDHFIVQPQLPNRVILGVRTFHYRFDSEDQAKELLNWTQEQGWQPEFVQPKQVPASVTRRQARQQLLIAGLLSAVEPAIAAITDDTTRQMIQIYWEDSTAFERDNPYLIQLATVLGMDADALDDAFIAAAQL